MGVVAWEDLPQTRPWGAHDAEQTRQHWLAMWIHADVFTSTVSLDFAMPFFSRADKNDDFRGVMGPNRTP